MDGILNFNYELNFEALDGEVSALKQLEKIYNTLNKRNNTWCYSDKLSFTDKYDMYEYKYIFTFSHEFYFFEVYADLERNNMYIREKLNFIHDDKYELAETDIFGIEEDVFLDKLQKFMKINEIDFLLKSSGANVFKIYMFLKTITDNIDDIGDDISYYKDEEDIQEILSFLRQGNDKLDIELYNKLIRDMLEENYTYSINNHSGFTFLCINFQDNLIEMVFDEEDLLLMEVSMEKISVDLGVKVN